jgi:gliding motility-associated-like protein
MKKIIYSLVVLFTLIALESRSQVFWYEGFGNGCSQGQLANAFAPTPTNGAWVVTPLAVPFPNGVDANEWFISAAEQGQLVGNCGTGCGGTDDRTLHMGSNILVPIPIVDPGAAYLAGATAFTNKRVESAIIPTIGKTGIQLSFKYLGQGIPASDFCNIVYSTNGGATWNTLQQIAPSNNAACIPQGAWTFFAVGLPATCDNIPNLRIGFHWRNNDLAGADPSIAIDDIQLSTMTVTFPPIPCPAQTVVANLNNIPPGVTGYTWTSIPPVPTVTFNPPTGSANPTVTFPAPGVYTVIVFGSTLPGGVPTATAVQVVTVNISLSINGTPPQTVCPGSNATLTAMGATTYTWNLSAVAGPLLGNTNSIVVTCPTPSVVNYFVTGTLGMCVSNPFICTVTYTNIPLTLTISPQNLTVCPGSAVSLTASGATNYTWSIPGNPTLTPTTNPLADTAPIPFGTYVYTVTGDNGGCTGTQTVDVVVGNVPFSLTLTPTTPTICQGQTITLTASGAANYTWTPSATLSNSTGTTVDATPTITTTYNVLGELGGCTTNTQITVTITPGPNLLINTTANAVCAGYTSTITASGAMSYSWTGTTFTGSINQPSISMGPGCYTVVSSSTAFVCPAIKAVCIASMAPLQIGISQSSFTTCIANNSPKYSLPVTLNANGGSTYNWAPCVGGFLSICIGNSVIARPQTTTQYTVTGFTSVCSGTGVITVTVVPQSTLNVQPPMPIACLGGCFNFTVINTNTTLPQPYTYSWSVPNPVVGSIINPLSPLVVACPSVSSTYSVEMKDFRNCATEQRLVHTTIIPQPITAAQIPTINGVPTNSICYVGDIVDITTNTLTLCAVNFNGTLQAGVVPSYTWYSYSAPSNSLMNEGSIKTPTSDPCVIISPVTKLPAVMTYTLRSGFNGNGGGDGINGCFREDTVNIRVVDCRRVTSVTFTTVVLNDTVCTKQCVTFTNTTDAGEPQYVKWTFPGGAPNTSTLQAPTVCYNLPGKYNVFLIDSNQYGPAVATGTFQFIKVVDVPNTTIVPPGQTRSDTTVRFGMAVALTGTGASTYAWSPPYMIDNLYGPKTKVHPQQTTQYILTGCNSRGCCSNDTINVIVIDDCGEMFVPNAFSPNGRDDPENETLKVYGYCLESMTFQVFNRWGQKVWETSDQNIGWDGTFKGEELNTGVFVYRLEGKDFKGKGYSLKGSVSLIR